MSSGSKRRQRKMMERLAKAAERVGKEPITGNMAERMTALSKQEDNTRPVGHSQLPIHYGGSPSIGFQGNGGGYKGDTAPVSGYRPSKAADDEDVFTCESRDITGECPIAKVPGVYVPRQLFDIWIELADENATEWLAYLRGSFDKEKGRWNVTSCYFPPQTATGGHVDVADHFETLPGTIGAVHSHVKMQVFFSGEDMAHSNWPVEIVVNARAEVKVMVRHQLKCGEWGKNYSKVWLVGDKVSSGHGKLLEAAFAEGDKLRKERAANSQQTGYQPYSGVGYQPYQGGYRDYHQQDKPIVTPPDLGYRFWCEDCKKVVVGTTWAHWEQAHGGKRMEWASIAGSSVMPEEPIAAKVADQAAIDKQLDDDMDDLCQLCDGHGWCAHGECPRCGGIGWEPGSEQAAEVDTPPASTAGEPVSVKVIDLTKLN